MCQPRRPCGRSALQRGLETGRRSQGLREFLPCGRKAAHIRGQRTIGGGKSPEPAGGWTGGLGPAGSPSPPGPARGRSSGSPPRVPAAPHPVAPRHPPLGGHSCASWVFAAAAEEVGLGGQRAQQELRGIGETFDISIPVFPSTRPPPPFRGSRRRGEVTEPHAEGAARRPRHPWDSGTASRRLCFALGRPGLFG